MKKITTGIPLWIIRLFLFTIILYFSVVNSFTQENTDWNLLLGARVAVSDYSPGNPPENAFLKTHSPLCWSADGGGMQWLEADFKEAVTINRFELTFGHNYSGEPIAIYGRNIDGNYKLLHRFKDENLAGDTSLIYTPSEPWASIEFVRIESPESPVTLCWRDLELIGNIPGSDPPDDISENCRTTPDIIYHNGTIITMDSSKPAAEAVAIHLNKVIGVGTDEEMLTLQKPGCNTSLVDLNGLTVLPGFNDSHSHWFSWRQHICSVTGDTTNPSLDEIMQMLSSLGWTSISELNFGRPDNSSAEHLQNALDLAFHGKLSVRLNGYWGQLNDMDLISTLADSGRFPGESFSGRIRAPGVKIYVDDPFGTTDILTQEEVSTQIQLAHNDGWQVAAHAVNESAVEKILSAYENVLGLESNENYRYRIEHAVKVSDDQLSRMKNKGIITSFQLMGPADWPEQETFQTYISNTNPEWCLRWKDLVNAEPEGLHITGSTDAPFNDTPCDYSPFRVIYQAVTRMGFLDRAHAGWELNQRLTIQECLKLLSIDGAYATFEENKKGSITPGKLADLIVVSGNPLEVASPEDLLNIKVLLTMVGGHIEYCDNSGYPDLCLATEAFNINSAIITASDYLIDQTPDQVFDNNTETNWGAGDYAPQWIKIDLMNNYKITGVDLIADQYPDGTTVHQLLAGKNNPDNNFELLHEFSGYTTTGQVLSYSAPSSTDSFRYIKVLTTESPSWVSWKEIRIYKNGETNLKDNRMNSLLLSDLKISPMPLTNNSVLSYNLAETTIITANIVTANGTVLFNWFDELQSQGSHTIFIDQGMVNRLPTGVSFLILNTSGATYVEKLVKY